jgi:flagellar biosynthesis protein FlhG
MLDQAHDLRRLATRCNRAETPHCNARPALVVVAGGKGGVGTTTVALALAAAAAKAGRRPLLVDTDSRGGDVALTCGIEERYTLADVLAGQCTWNEAVCHGPAGVGVLVGRRGWHDNRNPAAAAGRLLEQLDHQDLATDLVVIDAGNRSDGVTPHICREATAVVIVSSGDVASVVGAFAAIKALLAASHNRDRRPPLYLLVNMARGRRVAEIVYYRLARTCRRLLGIELQSAGHLRLARRGSPNSKPGIIGLNLQVNLADTIRGVSVAKALSN